MSKIRFTSGLSLSEIVGNAIIVIIFYILSGIDKEIAICFLIFIFLNFLAILINKIKEF